MKFLVFCLLFLLGAGTADARCSGIDYRTRLTPAELTTLKREAAKIPFAYGNHWVATRNGQRIHVIGTMHGGDTRMAKVMRTLRPVIRSADEVLFEITGDKVGPDSFERSIDHFLLPQNRRLHDLFADATWDTVSQLALARGLNPTKVDTLQPWAASMFLINDGCTPLGFGTTLGLDDRIERYARRKGIPIGSLETTDESFSALSRVPLGDQVRSFEIELAMLLADKPDDATAVEAYFEQSLWEAMIMHQWSLRQYVDTSERELDRHWRRFENNMINWRNKNWINRILRTKGDTIVVAVGGAHLPGKSGLLNLLQARGFNLERAAW